MNKIFKIIIISCILIFVLSVSGSLIYYYVFFRPEIEKAEIRLQEEKQRVEEQQKKNEEIKIEQEKQEKEIKEVLNKEYLAKCLDEAYQNYAKDLDDVFKTYIENWNAECKRLGLAPDSALPNKLAESLNESYKTEVGRMDIAYENAKKDCYNFWSD